MAGSTRFELASSSPEGSAFNATYPNGQRGSYGGATLDRSGSFRDSMDNRMLSAGSGTPRGGPTSMEMPPLTQYLTLEAFTLPEQKFARCGELKRILGGALGVPSEDHPFGTALVKPLLPLVSDELKRFRMSLLETSIKAKDRLKTINDSTVKLDKYRHTLFSRKRQRNEISSDRSSGSNLLKMGNQISQPPADLVTQRLEDRTKTGVPNKRVRTSMVESEGRNNTISRQSMLIDKERETMRAGNGGSIQVEDKMRGLPAGGDGWDKKMKRKRSVGMVVNRTVDGDREVKRGVPQRLNNEARSQFRSASSSSLIGINKLEGTSQPVSSTRAAPRNELDNVSQSDRRDRVGILDKEKILTKGNNKLSLREDNQVGSPSPVAKGKASRAVRTGSTVMANSSPNLPRTSGALEGWDQGPSSHKVQPVSGLGNRKRPLPAGSSSPPVAQWVVQRQQKSSRTRRTNLVSPVSNNDDSSTLYEGLSNPDMGGRSSTNEASGPSVLGRGMSNNTQQLKLKLDNIASPVGLSESEESGAGDGKSKEKGLESGEMEDRNVNATQKVGTFVLPSKKNKISVKEDIGDGVRRQWRSGRVSAQSRVGMSLTKEKVENIAAPKPVRGSRPDKAESRSGRPPTKKLSERKLLARPGHVMNSSSEFIGESDDDHEALLAVANSACLTNYHASSGAFWKQLESIFAFVSSEDMVYLKQQIDFAEELDETRFPAFGGSHNDMDELVGETVTSSETPTYSEKQSSQPNGTWSYHSGMTANSANGPRNLDANIESVSWFEKIIPLSQRLLAAFIVEEEIEDGDKRDFSCQYASDDSPCTMSHIDTNESKETDKMESEIESEADLKIQKHCSMDCFSCDGSTGSSNFRSINVRNHLCNDDLWREEDGLGHAEVGDVTQRGQNGAEEPQSIKAHHSDMSSFGCNYQQMSLDERILAELHSIGIFPDTVPDLAEGEDEEIRRDISRLKKGLYQQVHKKKGQLYKLERAVQKAREPEERKLEQLAMDKLVDMAHKKLLASRGSNSSNKSGVSKASKQAALGFAKRTLARFRKFTDTGRSCFSEPPYKNVIFCTPVKRSDSTGTGTVGNLFLELHNGQPDFRGSGASEKIEKVQFDRYQGLSNHEPVQNKSKKRELLLDDVVGLSASRAASSVGNSLIGGAKGKRSERDREQNKESTRSSVAKAGRPVGSSLKGERRTKTKPKLKTAQLSTSGNGLIGRFTEATDPLTPSGQGNRGGIVNGSTKLCGEAMNPSKEMEDPIDLTNIPLPGIETLGDDLGDQGQDLSSWLNFDADGLQDNDLMGLDIPMDDLNMIL